MLHLPPGGMTLFLSENLYSNRGAVGPVCAIFTSLPDINDTTLKLFISNADDTQFLPIQDDQAMETRGGIENSGTIRTIRLDVFVDDIEMFFLANQFNCTVENKWEQLSVSFAVNITSADGE